MYKNNKPKLFVSTLIFLLSLVILCSTSNAQDKSTLDIVLEKGLLTVAVFSDVPPSGFYNEKNELVGIDVEIAKAMARELGVDIEFVSTTNPNRIPYLVTNKVDCVLATFFMNSDRRKVVEFSDPYYGGGATLVINTQRPESNEIETFSDMEGKILAVAKGSSHDESGTEILGGLVKEILRFENVSDLYLALRDGKADAIAEDIGNAGYIIQQKYPQFKVTGQMLNEESYGIGVRRGDQIWLNWINGFIFDIICSGELYQIYDKYGLKYTPKHYAVLFR